MLRADWFVCDLKCVIVGVGTGGCWDAVSGGGGRMCGVWTSAVEMK